MELNFLKNRKYLSYFGSLWVILLLVLGAWWLFIIFKISSGEIFEHNKITKMLFWEGLSFLVLLGLLSITMFYLYMLDIRKQRSLGAFFAAVTHELRTPLASIRLQSEVIMEVINQKPEVFGKSQIPQLGDRLIEDVYKLEDEFEKLLQLSRIERIQDLPLESFSLKESIDSILKTYKSDDELDIKVNIDSNYQVEANEFALSVILKNLLSNTQKHSPMKKVIIEVKELRGQHQLSYREIDHKVSGTKEWTKLFYKNDKSKGSGVGLYLCSNLAHKMKGKFSINEKPELSFELQLLRSPGDKV